MLGTTLMSGRDARWSFGIINLRIYLSRICQNHTEKLGFINFSKKFLLKPQFWEKLNQLGYVFLSIVFFLSTLCLLTIQPSLVCSRFFNSRNYLFIAATGIMSHSDSEKMFRPWWDNIR